MLASAQIIVFVMPESSRRPKHLFYRAKKVAPPNDEPPLLASSLKLILGNNTIKLEGKQDLRNTSEVTLSGGRYEDIYT